MTPTETLTKAIEKAVANGWDTQKAENPLLYAFPPPKEGYWTVTGFLFDHGFAKALFGEEWLGGRNESIPSPYHARMWEYHLQQMVISPDPIKYLAEHIEKEEKS